MFISVLNNSATPITAGQIVYQTGFNTLKQIPTVALASAASSVTASALGIANSKILVGAIGSVTAGADFFPIDTSAFSINGTVYLSNTPGAISPIPGTISLPIGGVLIVSTNGTIFLGSKPPPPITYTNAQLQILNSSGAPTNVGVRATDISLPSQLQILNSSGNPTNVGVGANDLRMPAITFPESIITGAIQGGTYDNLFGYATSTGFRTVILASTYVAQGVNLQISVASTNVNDTAGGIGANSINIIYFDQNLNGPFTETITLNGLTPVNSVNSNYAYIEKIVVTTAGTDTGNDGSINVFTAPGGGGFIWASVNAGENGTYWCQHYIPAGRTAYITRIVYSVAAVPGFLSLECAKFNPNGFFNLNRILFQQHDGVTSKSFNFDDSLITIAGPAFCVLAYYPDAITPNGIEANLFYVQQ